MKLAMTGFVLTAAATGFTVWASIALTGRPIEQASTVVCAFICGACTAVWTVLLVRSVWR